MDFFQEKGKLEKDYPLSKLNTWKIGGRAEFVFWPQSSAELIQAVHYCRDREIPVFLIGLGSNILFPDRGLKGMVIVSRGLQGISWQEDMVRVEAGYSLRRLTAEAAARGLGGLEFACGIPGTVGGAIVMNAGAYGAEIGSLVRDVSILTPSGEEKTLPGQDISFGYRTSTLLDGNFWLLASTIKLEPGKDSKDLEANISALLAKRRQTQPLEFPNAGSVFRNPPGNSAGRLIEQAGWKGFRLGDAQVSEKHANFIVNRGKAKAEEIICLIGKIQEDIYQKYGVELQTEIRIIGG